MASQCSAKYLKIAVTISEDIRAANDEAEVVRSQGGKAEVIDAESFSPVLRASGSLSE